MLLKVHFTRSYKIYIFYFNSNYISIRRVRKKKTNGTSNMYKKLEGLSEKCLSILKGGIQKNHCTPTIITMALETWVCLLPQFDDSQCHLFFSLLNFFFDFISLFFLSIFFFFPYNISPPFVPLPVSSSSCVQFIFLPLYNGIGLQSSSNYSPYSVTHSLVGTPALVEMGLVPYLISLRCGGDFFPQLIFIVHSTHLSLLCTSSIIYI